MSFPTTAAILLVLATPASATPWRDIHDFEQLHQHCGGADDPVHDKEDVTKACVAADRLRKKLEAHGYCIVGHGEVGRSSKDRKHCYFGFRKNEHR